jgi:plastocyanin
MHSARSGVLLVGVMLVAAGCEGPSRVTAPRDAAAAARSGATGHEIAEWKHGNIPLQLRDQCDPTTFNQAVGAGDCIPTPSVTHRVTFQEFLSQIEVHHSVQGWFNNPGLVLAAPHSTINALNTGGEAHTFTRVAKYGGGFVPVLNGLSGTPKAAPECLSLPPTEILGPGQTDHEALPNKPGLYHYQCCIHPWMKTDVMVGNH